MITVQELKTIFGVSENQELADKLKCSAQAISNWKRDGVPALAERKARALMVELGIVSESSEPHQRTGNTGNMSAPHPHDDELSLDEIQKLLIKQWSKKGHAAMLREVARLLEEEEKAATHG